MDAQKYLEERVDDQLGYFEAKSGKLQKKFKRLKTIEIVLAAIVPFLITSVNDDEFGSYLQVLVGAMSVGVVIVAGLLTLHKHYELWVQYRATAESLKREKFLYLTRTGPYKGKNAFPVFVETIESIIAEDTSQWRSVLNDKSDGVEEEPEENNPPQLPA